MDRQDEIDNAIFQLCNDLNDSGKELEWDIEFIGKIRDVIASYYYDQDIIEDVNEFYP